MGSTGGHVLTAWVTLYPHLIGNTFPHRMGDTSGAICLGKQLVKKNSGGNFCKNFCATKPHSASFVGVGGSVEKQLTNGSLVLKRVAGLE
jgi:hypothetical protein